MHAPLRSRSFILLFATLTLSGPGCQAVSEVDRDEIPSDETDGAAGSAGDADADARMDSAPDATQDAEAGKQDADAGFDAEAGYDSEAGEDAEAGTDADSPDAEAGYDAGVPEAGHDAESPDAEGPDAEAGSDAGTPDADGPDAEAGYDSEAGEDAEAGGVCAPASKRCEGNTPQLCGNAGTWTGAVECVNQTCAGGDCVGVCSPSQTQCSQNTPQSCDAWGNWAEAAACVGQTCVGGACQGGCAPGQKQCTGNTPQSCDASGQWTSAAACSGNTPVCRDGECVGSILILGGNAVGTIGGEYHPGMGWTMASLGGASTRDPGLAANDAGDVIGVIRNESDGQIQYTRWTGATGFTQFAPIDASVVTPPEELSLSAGVGSGAVQLVYYSNQYLFHYASWSGGAWSPIAEPVSFSGEQSTSLRPAFMAARSADAAIAFSDPFSGDVVQERNGGAWGGLTRIDSGNEVSTRIYGMVALEGGDHDLLLVRRDPQSGHIRSCARNRTTRAWNCAFEGALGLTDVVRVALTSLPGGGAMLAFLGPGKWINYRIFAGTNYPTWSALIETEFVSNTWPALARGVTGADAELAFVGTDGHIYHARYAAGWQSAVLVGGDNISHVAIASSP